jgi:hypothetical protein
VLDRTSCPSVRTKATAVVILGTRRRRDVEDLCSLAVLNSICRMDDYSDFFFADDGNWLCEML